MQHAVDLDLQPHAASGLVPCESEVVRSGLGLDPAYWTVLDDGAVERCIVLIGQPAGTGEPGTSWRSACLDARAMNAAGKTDDAAAIASHRGWVYVFGSANGAPRGPLRKERSFAARFHEKNVRLDEEGALSTELHVAADPFLLHRLVNDALAHAGVPLFAFSRRYLERTVLKARRKALDKGRKWSWRLACDDVPVDIRGAAFTPEGHLLLGLRSPTTRHGEALVVELRHASRLFETGGGEPAGGRVFAIGGVGSRREPLGVHDLHVDVEAGVLHALLGDLDPDTDASLLLAEHPEGARAESVHVRMTLPGAPKTLRAKASRAPSTLKASVVQRFGGLHRVEGIVADARRRPLYVSVEEDRARLRFAVPDARAAASESA